MPKIEIVPFHGEPFRMEVEAVKFVKKCPHCDVEFCDIDHRKVYPNKSHADMQTRNRRIIRDLRNN